METLGLSSRGYFLYDNNLGVGVFGNEAETGVAVASLTKMMTALLAVERLDLGQEVMITGEMVKVLDEFVVVGLEVGQKVTVEDLLYATMLPSAGDAAQALAVSVSGSLEKFVEEMNARAAEIGMKNTRFTNAVGFDEGNYSTPRDMAMLVREALGNEKFREVWGSFAKETPSLGRKMEKTFTKNGILDGFSDSGNVYTKALVTGGKTGYTEAAGRCLASTAEIEGTEWILVTVGAEKGENVADAGKVYEWVRANFEPVRIVGEGELVMRLRVRGSKTEEIEVVAPADRVVAMENGTAGEVEFKYEGIEEITRETAAGKVGELVARKGEVELWQQEVYYDGGIEFYDYGWVGVWILILLIGVGMGVLKWRPARSLASSALEPPVRAHRTTKRASLARFCSALKKLKDHRGILAVLVVIGVGVVIFGSWFEEKGKTEIVKTGVEVVAAEEENSGGNETVAETDGMTEAGGAGVENGGNCTTGWGNLMLINPNFRVNEDFIAGRQKGLVSVSGKYGIPEYNRAGNGDNMMMPEAAEALAKMVSAYKQAYAGHEMGTYSCFRARGTTCGRLCAATGTSDHHTGLTCDLIDLAYGADLSTDDYGQHVEWQWLRENSYKYGFVDRFPEAWAGGTMAEALNVDENGTTGLFETWHYRYVGVEAASEIANGKYNGGKYDSLEHYLKATGKVGDLKNGGCRGG